MVPCFSGICHQIHHQTPISNDEDVYNPDTPVIVTPKRHISIHKRVKPQ
ncbi:hypothetical protein [Pseudomonas sp. S31]